MTIEGLCVRPEHPIVPVDAFKSGQPDVDEAVGVTLEAYKLLGFEPDEDQAKESLADNFRPIAELGYDGRLYVEPPQGVSFDAIIAAADGKRPSNVEPTYRWPNLWTPTAESSGYTTKELDAAAEEPEARLAVFNADEETDVDPVLHFLGQPHDERHREAGQQTQLEALEATKEAIAANHEHAFAQALGHRAASVMVLMDRIRGVDAGSSEFILNQGWMYLPNLGRREVDGVSVVGLVYSGGVRRGRRRRGPGRWRWRFGGA
jgi:hypothetical protein